MGRIAGSSSGQGTSWGERGGRSADIGRPVPYAPYGGRAGKKGAFYGPGLANDFLCATDL